MLRRRTSFPRGSIPAALRRTHTWIEAAEFDEVSQIPLKTGINLGTDKLITEAAAAHVLLN